MLNMMIARIKVKRGFLCEQAKFVCGLVIEDVGEQKG